MFELSAFFNSAGKSCQRIVPITLVSKPNLLAFMLPYLFTVTPELRL